MLFGHACFELTQSYWISMKPSPKTVPRKSLGQRQPCVLITNAHSGEWQNGGMLYQLPTVIIFLMT